MRVVAKFGGTSLGSGDRINRAADSVADAVADGHEIAVVASAMGSTTDDLLEEIEFEGRGVQLLSAHSGEEAKALLEELS